jgi:ELWxxDGT repeat protein
MKKINRLPYTLMLLLCMGIGTSITAQKISLIDINKIKSSNPSNYQNYNGSVFAVLNGNFYFSADDGIHGQELFTSDGTANGTHLVKDISVGEVSSNVVLIKTAGSKIYFQTINNATYSGTLWVSDGTEAGTVPVANLPIATAGSCYDFTDVNGSLFLHTTITTTAVVFKNCIKQMQAVKTLCW